ncbi:MAG: ribonuclease J [Patescibacteria group bacterium]|jgi:ribonuclease J
MTQQKQSREPGSRPVGQPHRGPRHHGSAQQGGRHRGRHGQKPSYAPRGFKPTSQKNTPAQNAGKLRIIPLGGMEEVGRNSILLEYGNDIIMIDCGLQFPEEDMPGIDYVIPNISYLKGKEKNVRGVLITHGHYDHIGGIPHIVPKIGNPIVYGTDLTLGIIKKRQDDFQALGTPRLQIVTNKTKLKLGVFKVEFFGVSHNIPGSLGIIIDTPVGKIVHTGDFKLDRNPVGDRPMDFARINQLGNENVVFCMADSTNASRPGRQFSEQEIQGNLEDLFKQAKGRMIIGTFASLIARLQQIIWFAEKYNRKVVVEGYSMKTNIEIAKELGYIKAKKDTLIDVKAMKNYPANRITIICTGAQGEGRAVLMRIANREHKFIKIEKGDTVIFSSSVVPGNERSVQRLTDSLYREGAEVINYRLMDIHAGGHALQEDLIEFNKMVRPKWLMPVEGNHSFHHHHKKAVVQAGFPEKNVLIVDNGQVVTLDKGGNALITKERVDADYVFIDGLGIENLDAVVVRDRRELADEGMVVIIVRIQGKTGKLIGRPDIITRGFIYVKESRKLMDETIKEVKRITSDREPRSSANDRYIRDNLRDELGKFFFKKTERRPMILPVVIEV